MHFCRATHALAPLGALSAQIPTAPLDGGQKRRVRGGLRGGGGGYGPGTNQAAAKLVPIKVSVGTAVP